MSKNTLSMIKKAYEIYNTEEKNIKPLIGIGMNENSAKDTMRCFSKLLSGELHTRAVPNFLTKYLLHEFYESNEQDKLSSVIKSLDKNYLFRKQKYNEPNISARLILEEYR